MMIATSGFAPTYPCIVLRCIRTCIHYPRWKGTVTNTQQNWNANNQSCLSDNIDDHAHAIAIVFPFHTINLTSQSDLCVLVIPGLPSFPSN